MPAGFIAVRGVAAMLRSFVADMGRNHHHIHQKRFEE